MRDLQLSREWRTNATNKKHIHRYLRKTAHVVNNNKLSRNQQGNQESMGGASILAIELDRYSSARTNTDRDLNGWDVRIADTQGSPETRIEKTNHF